PAAFVAIEYARAHVLSGCPWELLGHALRAARMIQLCDATGVYGLSFLLVLSSVAIVEFPHRRTPAVVAGAAVLPALADGQWRPPAPATPCPCCSSRATSRTTSGVGPSSSPCTFAATSI